MSSGMSSAAQIDKGISALGRDPSIDEALGVVWSVYEQATGETLSFEPSHDERQQVATWLRELRTDDDGPLYLRPPRSPVPLIGRTVPELASIITQYGCAFHQPDLGVDGPYSYSFPVRIDPWSAQSSGREKVAIRKAVTGALLAKGVPLMPWGTRPLCLTVTAIIGRRGKVADVDNLAKGLLDAMQGYLYENDSQIQCLTLRRMPYAGTVGHYLVRAVPVRAWSDYVVFDDPAQPKVLTGEVGYPGR
jgi:hypothetical protein